MTLACMAGAIGGGITITLAASYSASALVSGGATAQFELTSAGDVRMTNGNNSVVDVGDWLAPKTNMAGFDCMLTLNSGTSPTGSALATWLNLGTTRNWQITRGGSGVNTNNCTVQIRNAVSLTVLDTATVLMTADAS